MRSSKPNKVVIRHRPTKQWLTPTGGYLTGYTHTLNPYAGCDFACSYCYVRRMPPALFRGLPWGEWVDVKEADPSRFAAELARKKRKGPVRIFMSSATDPYQRLEAKEQVTRALLEAMAADPPDFLLIQTRSPLVTRDLDLIRRLRPHVRVSMTIETDREDVRQAFSPGTPPLAARRQACLALREAGIPLQIAVSPLLPCTDRFAGQLARLAPDRVVLDDFFMGDGSGGKRTKQLGLQPIFADLDAEEWYQPDAYRRILALLKNALPEGAVYVSQPGFLP
ncbi:radical SAM protein [Xylanibacillus composti]|uniref:Radical SAM core domain-containing protein n=1 Tax=Xylanibacillus composti TaxID=1572762 RepID=A0A8J4M1A0_9BACL|nr:radical SAM protein [Xylanibacillus composti]MDT9723984.1 radical SAM protein [Xylanibacillus composti]GIQ67865.1 hypothetical protein XYCOK13_06890 [Xylanibacillus composti]